MLVTSERESVLLGNVIDAHPNSLIGNELIFLPMLKNRSLGLMEATRRICEVSRKQAKHLHNVRGKGYSYKMGDFHGTFRQPLKVIGVRRSFDTITYMKEHPKGFHIAINRLQERWPLVGVMVVRNPFDMISTRSKEMGAVMTLKHPQTGKLFQTTIWNCSKITPPISSCLEFIRDSMANGTTIVSEDKDVDEATDAIEEHAELSNQLMESMNHNFSAVIVQLEDLISHPRKYAELFCEVLELPCDETYINGVVAGVLDSPNPSRNGVKWTQTQIERVNKIVDRFPSIFTMPRLARLDP